MGLCSDWIRRFWAQDDSNFVAAEAGLSYFPPLLFVALRFGVPAVALPSYVVLTRSREALHPQIRGDVDKTLETGVLPVEIALRLHGVGLVVIRSGSLDYRVLARSATRTLATRVGSLTAKVERTVRPYRQNGEEVVTDGGVSRRSTDDDPCCKGD